MDNIRANRFMDGITLPNLQDEDRELLNIEISETEVLQAIKSLQNKKTSGPDDSLKIATITLLPIPGKDKQKCDSYRPLSLLNADYKILSKLIALRLEDVIPKIINTDQTGTEQIMCPDCSTY
uniref:Uncharacterized protein n=1 Tax=Cyprinodon variegatus TaxID=28743 RepID=A0A3Q2FJM3_CYPVA